jgi:lysophospholipase L1-like esterase
MSKLKKAVLQINSLPAQAGEPTIDASRLEDIGPDGFAQYFVSMMQYLPNFQEGVAYSFVVQGGVLNLGLGGAVVGKKRMAVCLLDSITEGYGLANPSTEAWPAVLAAQTTDIYGQVVNKGISGNTLQDGLNRMADITSAYNFTDYSGVDVFYLGGVNNLGHQADTVSNMLPQYQNTITQLKAPNPPKVRVFLLTILPSIWPYYDAARAAYVTTTTNTLNAEFRSKAVSQWGAADVIEVDRITALQSPADTGVYQDKLHPNKQGNLLLGTAVATYARTGLQPTGSIPTNQQSGTGVPAGFTGLVAPDSGESQQYDSTLDNFTRTGAWFDNNDYQFWEDGHGVYGPENGSILTSKLLYTRSVKVLTAVNPYGGDVLLELVRNSDNSVVASQTVSMNGANGVGPSYTLNAPSLDVYYFRETNIGTGHAFLGGIILSRAAVTTTNTTVSFSGNGIGQQPAPELNYATGDSTVITATVGDNAGTITYLWEKVSSNTTQGVNQTPWFIDGGPGHDNISRTVYLGGLRANGTYVLKVSGTKNGTAYSGTVTITVNFSPPIV